MCEGTHVQTLTPPGIFGRSKTTSYTTVSRGDRHTNHWGTQNRKHKTCLQSVLPTSCHLRTTLDDRRTMSLVSVDIAIRTTMLNVENYLVFLSFFSMQFLNSISDLPPPLRKSYSCFVTKNKMCEEKPVKYEVLAVEK
jgi:hypothetical protein